MPNPAVELCPADDTRKHVIRNLYQLYEYDMAEFLTEPVDDDGLFRVTGYLDHYWLEPERHPFLILTEGQLAGFTLVREFEPGTHSIAEFFVMRYYRRRGIGRIAAHAAFRAFPGRWSVAQGAERPSSQNCHQWHHRWQAVLPTRSVGGCARHESTRWLQPQTRL